MKHNVQGQNALRRSLQIDSFPHLQTSCTQVEQFHFPLGLLLFALTLQGPLQRTATAHPATQIVAYFDDINVVGPPAAAAPAFEALAMEVRTAG
jgi:hypothetical protein